MVLQASAHLWYAHSKSPIDLLVLINLPRTAI